MTKCSLCSNEFKGEPWIITIAGHKNTCVYGAVCPECFAKVDRKITDILEGFGEVKLPNPPALSKGLIKKLHDNPCFDCAWSDVEEDRAVSCYKYNAVFGPYVSERCEHFTAFKEEE